MTAGGASEADAQMTDQDGRLFLGRATDESSGDDSKTDINYKTSNLTTHGVIVGMTGSGKTGLGVIMLEEALLEGIPTLIIDPKGDMGNLLLQFPNFAADDFAPWVGEGDDAAATANLWKTGLEGYDIGTERMAQLAAIDKTIYTPGSSAGVGLNVIGSMQAPTPAGGVDESAFNESKLDEIEGLVSALLGLIGVDSDPLSGREHIFLTNLIDHHWSRGQSLTLETLIQGVMAPPFRKLGVMQLDTLFPENDRMKLAMALNGLAASPAFAAWSEGVPLDIDDMLFHPDGRPRAAVVNIHHLSDEERQFVVTLLLSKVVTWMRSQSGSDDLRVLIYMDEVFGFVPPTAMPPSKKPILTLLKQARAFGIGLVLSTQNPVDIDYKALSNAGTWMIGRLQTERDKARLLDGMSRSDGSADVGELDTTISSLDKREFVLHSTRSAPLTFSTRWAMSYLAGPLSRAQITQLMDGRSVSAPSSAPAAAAAPSTAPAAPAEPQLADDETSLAPSIHNGIPVRYLRADAPWIDEIDLSVDPASTRLEPMLATRMRLLYDDTKADLRHESEWEAITPIGSGSIDADEALIVDYDDRDFDDDPPEGAVYALPRAELDKSPFFTAAKKAFSDRMYRSETLELFANKELDLYSRVGETEEEFQRRCEAAADDLADEKLEDALKRKDRDLDKQRTLLRKLEQELEALEDQHADANRDAKLGMLMDGVELLGGMLGGRRSRRSRSSAGRRVLSERRTNAKLRDRLEAKELRLSEEEEDLAEMIAEYDDLELEVMSEFNDKAQEVERYEVGLEKTDIAVDEIAVVWVPVRRS